MQTKRPLRTPEQMRARRAAQRIRKAARAIASKGDREMMLRALIVVNTEMVALDQRLRDEGKLLPKKAKLFNPVVLANRLIDLVREHGENISILIHECSQDNIELLDGNFCDLKADQRYRDGFPDRLEILIGN